MKKCPVCDTPIIGRSDKKYCSDDCRASYHNARNRSSNIKIRKINRILRRNRKILFEMICEDLQKIPKSMLQEKGFDFDHYTREMQDKGNGYKACYDIAYQVVEEEKELNMRRKIDVWDR